MATISRYSKLVCHSFGRLPRMSYSEWSFAGISFSGTWAMPSPMTRAQAQTVETSMAVRTVTDLPLCEVRIMPAISRRRS